MEIVKGQKMAIINFPSNAKERIYKQFPPVIGDEVPKVYEIKVIEYESERIEEYDVVFWHRLLKTIYQEPLEIECELHVKNQNTENPVIVNLRRLKENLKWEILNTATYSVDFAEETAIKIQSGEMQPIPVNWKYFIKLSDKGIIEIGTKDRHTVLYFAHVLSGQIKDVSYKQTKKFISLLLDEAKKAGNQLFNPLKEFRKNEGLKYYHIFNVYRANNVSAAFMLKEALTQEKVLREEFLKYDARTSDIYDEEKENHIDRYMLACGMYFSSAITYLFMALEGFINIVIHSFLRKDLRESNLNIEKRFDIEQKLHLMTSLCNGFIKESVHSTEDICTKFIKLKNYRNSIFHSKIEDSLKTLVFSENGFLYNCDVKKYKEQFLPTQKIMLSASDVIEVKNIVDGIIEMVLNSMTDDTRLLTDKYILKSTHIPFFIMNDGSLSLGESGQEPN
jgi:hypothetical protein